MDSNNKKAKRSMRKKEIPSNKGFLCFLPLYPAPELLLESLVSAMSLTPLVRYKFLCFLYSFLLVHYPLIFLIKNSPIKNRAANRILYFLNLFNNIYFTKTKFLFSSASLMDILINKSSVRRTNSLTPINSEWATK